MAWLKVYRWEAATWPEFQNTILVPKQVHKLIRKFARHFKTSVPDTRCQPGRRGGGNYRALIERITLYAPYYLDTVVHEFAHHLNHCRNKGGGHRRQFKRELKRVYTWAKRYLPKEK